METIIRRIEDFEVYQRARAVYDVFIDKDLPVLQKTFIGKTLAGNQLRCVDSICANMEEGYERKAGKEIKHFFRIAKGSAAEALGRYKRLGKVLPKEIIDRRVEELSAIRAMLHSLIAKWK